MSIGNKLGKDFDKIRGQLNIKTVTVDLGEVKFPLRVRVPLKREMEELNARVVAPAQERIDAAYERIAGPMRKTLEEGGEEFVQALNASKQNVQMLDNDLIVDGTSLRQVALFTAIEEQRTEEYFHLLVAEDGTPVTETYEEISAEFPEFAIKEMVQAIQSAISPNYKAAKKN